MLMKFLILLLVIFSVQNINGQTILNDSLINLKMYKAVQFLSGSGGSKNIKTAFELYLECAKAGKPQAMIMTGLMYKNGTGVDSNKGRAVFWFTKAGNAGYANGWYLLGDLYKNTLRKQQNYKKAFRYFSKGAALNDERCEFNKAYMLYKGFGCTQNYEQAAILFAKGARLSKTSSMYFYGLCLRNGYGIQANSDSALFWLQKAAGKGHLNARNEIGMMYPENKVSLPNREAATQNVTFITKNKSLKSDPIQEIFNEETSGKDYFGNLITYDWSGELPINVSKLQISLLKDGQIISGNWVENDSLSVEINAVFTEDGLKFNGTRYELKDHNSFNQKLSYHFETATLNQFEKGDSLYLFGNIVMYSPDRNEPQKPRKFIVAKKLNKIDSQNPVVKKANSNTNTSENILNVYPNPFTDFIRIESTKPMDKFVSVQLKSIEGKIVYSKELSIKNSIQISITFPPKLLTAGTYLLTLKNSNSQQTFRVVKL